MAVATLLLAITSVCLFGYFLHYHSSLFRDIEATLASFHVALLICVAAWLAFLFIVSFSLSDLLVIGLLFFSYLADSPATGAAILLGTAALGRGARVALEVGSRKSEFRDFLVGLVVLMAFSSWWRLDTTNNVYHGPRWMGLWNDPNVYGMLMGAEVVLAIGLQVGRQNEEGRMQKFISVILMIAVGMMGVGLLFSYSRGAWVGTAVGLLYLAKVYGRFKRRYLFAVFFIAAAVVWLFWNAPRTAPWYWQRLDFSGGSVQHRLAAWERGFEMMWDHPFGVGWNKAVEIYGKNYSPPAAGAGAIVTNDYLILGTQLGLPALACFLAYVVLCFRDRKSEVRSQKLAGEEEAGGRQTAKSGQFGIRNSEFAIKTACRAGALAMLVAFWFDGGLFKLATATVFWTLLELGSKAEMGKAKGKNGNAEMLKS